MSVFSAFLAFGVCFEFRVSSFELIPFLVSNYLLAQLDEIEPQRCPCGFSRRAFATPDNALATLPTKSSFKGRTPAVIRQSASRSRVSELPGTVGHALSQIGSIRSTSARPERTKRRGPRAG